MSIVLFNGKVLREPRAATKVLIGVPPTVNPGATNRVLVIGPSEGGLPVADQAVYTFSSASEAASVLRSGDSLRAISYIFNPSPSFGGAAQVDFIRGDTVTAATLIAKDVQGTPANTLTFTSVDKGPWTNAIQIQIATATILSANDARVITVKVPNVAIQSGADGVLTTVTGTSFIESPTARFITKGARVGDFIYMSGQTAGSLAVFSIASVVSETKVQLVGTPSPTTGTALTWSHITYGRVQTSDPILQGTDASNPNQGIINWLVDNCSDVVTAVQFASGQFVAAVGPVNLSGATLTAMTNTEITNALVLARDLNVQHIYVARACGTLSGELDFSGLIRGHILNDAETPAMGYVGSKVDVTMAQALTYAGAINSGKMVYAFQTFLDSTLDGLSTEYLPGYFLAAKMCGLAAGILPQSPLTRKALSILGLKINATDGKLDRTKREKLLKGGVCHVFQQPGTTTFVVNQGVTTIQKQDNLWDTSTGTSPEISLNRIVDTLLNNLRTSAEVAFIGGTASIGKSVVENFVRSYLESERGNLIIDWRSLVVNNVADRWEVTFGFVPNNPINYVVITGVVLG